MSDGQETAIPVLTEIIAPLREGDADQMAGSQPSAELEEAVENLIAELQTSLAAQAFALTEGLLHNAFTEMEATLFEQVSNRLRQELPELIDTVLRRHLKPEQETD